MMKRNNEMTAPDVLEFAEAGSQRKRHGVMRCLKNPAPQRLNVFFVFHRIARK